MSELQKIEVTKQKLEQISERVYWQSFVFFCLVVTSAIAGTGLLRFYRDPLVELVPANVLNFTERVIWVYVIPVTVKLLKDALPLLTGLIREIRELRAQITPSVSQETAQNIQQNQASQQIGGLQNVNNG